MDNPADWEMANADLELQQMGLEALDNCYRAGADPEDLKTVAWIAGLKWSPKPNLTVVHGRT